MDEAPTGWEQWKILITSGMGFFTDAYDLFIIGVVLKVLHGPWHISSLQTALVGATALVSAAIGSAVFGRIADVFGRKYIYGFEVLVLGAGAIASAFSPNIWWRRVHERRGVRAELGEEVELFPVQARTTSYGIAAAAGKIGAFIGTYALASLLTSAGLGRSMALVGGVSLLGLLVTLTLPKPAELVEDLPRPIPTVPWRWG